MPRIQMNPTSYTQINTNDAEFLIQNLTNDTLKIVVQDSGAAAPANNALPELVLLPLYGVCQCDLTGICWGQTVNVTADVGLTEA